MSNVKKDQKDTTVRNIFVGILIVLGLIWFNTFIHQNSFEDCIGNYTFLRTAFLAIFCTTMYYGCFNEDPMGEPFRDTTKLCAIGTAVSGVLALAALLLELGNDSFSIFGEKDIVIWWINIPKKYFYDVWAIIWFPFNINVIFKAMRKERFKTESLFYGCIAVSGLTIEGILLFRPMSNIWLVDLLVLNTATLALATWKYVLKERCVQKGNAFAVIALYMLIRIVLLPLQCDNWGESFSAFMYGENWADYASGVKMLIAKASFFGTSDYLLSSEYIHDWLMDRNKPLLQLLFYGGWASVITLMLLLTCFLIILVKLIGIENGRKHKNWLIFGTAAIMLSDRILFGVLYNFGVPVPIGLPFMGKSGSFMDVMALTLILLGAMENRTIQEFKRTENFFVPAEEILGVQDEYTIVDKDGDPYESYMGEFLDDEVKIATKDGNVCCDAGWYTIESQDYVLFTSHTSVKEKRLFILAISDGKWVLPEDPRGSIRKEICARYMAYNRPGCMEGEARHSDDEINYYEDS